MSDDKNGKAIDFDAGIGEPGEVLREGNIVRVGDRFRFTFDAAKFILAQDGAGTVVVVLSEIQVEADGCKNLVVVPE